MKKIDLKSEKTQKKIRYYLWEGLMLTLLVVNLVMILFDWIYSYKVIQDFLMFLLPDATKWYDRVIHQNFIVIDLCFVTVFLGEFIVRWIVAIVHKTYHSWLFYPFIHWYDALGCIPIGSFRFFRVLRVFTILYRLEKNGIVQLSKTYLFQTMVRYYNIILEEVSDRVVLNVLDGVKKEVATGSRSIDKIIDQAIVPHKEPLSEWLTQAIGISVSTAYEENKDAAQEYLKGLVTRSMEQNKELATIDIIPVLGDVVTSKLEKAVGDIVFNVVNEAMKDLSSVEKSLVIQKAVDSFFQNLIIENHDPRINEVTIELLSELLEIVKEKVSEKKWKLEYLERQHEKIRSEVEEDLDHKED
ncbi:hypothetical protein R9208_29435 [Flammeovirgaceae bacterium SG7u.132]|nr:hypothetical protein [Flammeovirgaceae bacterium SG7u.132]